MYNIDQKPQKMNQITLRIRITIEKFIIILCTNKTFINLLIKINIIHKCMND